MPVTLIRRKKSAKAKAQPKPGAAVQTSARPAFRRSASAYEHVRADVDRLAEVEARITKIQNKLAPLSKEAAAIRDRLTEAVDKLDGPRLPTSIPGHGEFVAEISARAKVVVTTHKDRLRKYMGKAYDAEAEVPIGVARRYLTVEQQARVFAEEYRGGRRIKLVPRVRKSRDK